LQLLFEHSASVNAATQGVFYVTRITSYSLFFLT